MNVMSRVPRGLSLVAGGAVSARAEYPRAGPTIPRMVDFRTRLCGLGKHWHLPAPSKPTFSELFAATPRDGGWIGFLFAQLPADKPLLWVQERMAILESGRIYPPGLSTSDLIHVQARDARDTLWAMEEGLRCCALSAVIGEIWGDPRALDFTATRRLAVASERSQVPCWLIRLSGVPNLSGARMRWRIASKPSLLNELDPRSPGASAWDVELFRARGHPKGTWTVSHDSHPFHLVAKPGDRALGKEQRLRA